MRIAVREALVSCLFIHGGGRDGHCHKFNSPNQHVKKETMRAEAQSLVRSYQAT
jgi:hypothetical protein